MEQHHKHLADLLAARNLHPKPPEADRALGATDENVFLDLVNEKSQTDLRARGLGDLLNPYVMPMVLAGIGHAAPPYVERAPTVAEIAAVKDPVDRANAIWANIVYADTEEKRALVRSVADDGGPPGCMAQALLDPPALVPPPLFPPQVRRLYLRHPQPPLPLLFPDLPVIKKPQSKKRKGAADA